MNIKGESVLADFKVMDIVDDNNPCPALLGITATAMKVTTTWTASIR